MTVAELEQKVLRSQNEESLDSVLNAFLPYFKRRCELPVADFTLATANEIYLETKTRAAAAAAAVDLDVAEEQVTWSNSPKVLSLFESFLSSFRGNFDTHIHLLFPMLCQPLDDYRPVNRIVGVRCARRFLEHTSHSLIKRFRIQDVLYESFKTSTSFDDLPLLNDSLALWIDLIEMIEEFGTRDFLTQCDQLLLLACREIELGRSEGRREAFLACLKRLVPLMSHTAIRYLRKLVTVLCEVRKEVALEEDDDVEEAMVLVIRYCWPRIDGALRSIILDAFPSLESVLSFVK